MYRKAMVHESTPHFFCLESRQDKVRKVLNILYQEMTFEQLKLDYLRVIANETFTWFLKNRMDEI